MADEKLLKLRKTVEDAKKAVFSAKGNDAIIKAMTAFQTAQSELEAYEDSLITPEQRNAQKRYDAALEAFTKTKTELDAAKDALKPFGINKGNGDPQGHAKKMDYATVQELRKDFKGGMKSKDIQTKYGVSSSAVTYYVNYLQHKLRKGDEAYTPLKNSYYPFGAPYAEDGIKENDDRYTVKKYTIEDLVKDVENAGEKLDPIAAKYAMTREKLATMYNEYILNKK